MRHAVLPHSLHALCLAAPSGHPPSQIYTCARENRYCLICFILPLSTFQEACAKRRSRATYVVSSASPWHDASASYHPPAVVNEPCHDLSSLPPYFTRVCQYTRLRRKPSLKRVRPFIMSRCSLHGLFLFASPLRLLPAELVSDLPHRWSPITYLFPKGPLYGSQSVHYAVFNPSTARRGESAPRNPPILGPHSVYVAE